MRGGLTDDRRRDARSGLALLIGHVADAAQAVSSATQRLEEAKKDLAERMAEMNRAGATLGEIVECLAGLKTAGGILREHGLAAGGNTGCGEWTVAMVAAMLSRNDRSNGVSLGSGHYRRNVILADRNRTILRQRLEGKSVKEISEEHGLSMSSVYALTRQAKSEGEE